MSAKQRADAEALKLKYARVFGCPIVCVGAECLEDGDIRVFHKFMRGEGFPEWSFGPSSQRQGEGKP